MKRGLVSILIVISLILVSLSFLNKNNILDITGMLISDNLSFKSERIFQGLSYKKTHITQLTSNRFNDNIFTRSLNISVLMILCLFLNLIGLMVSLGFML